MDGYIIASYVVAAASVLISVASILVSCLSAGWI